MYNNLTFTIQIFKEGKQFVSFTPEIEVASCGDTPEEAKNNLKIAIKAFLSSAKKMKTLDSILEQAGFIKTKKNWQDPYLICLDRLSISM